MTDDPIYAPIESAVTPVEGAQTGVAIVTTADPTQSSGPSSAPALVASEAFSTYRTQPSDTWESVAALFGVDVADLFAANVGAGGVYSRESFPVNADLKRP